MVVSLFVSPYENGASGEEEIFFLFMPMFPGPGDRAWPIANAQ